MTLPSKMANEVDRVGQTLCYVANIYWQDKSGSRKHLIRRSRMPETAEALRTTIAREGIQALRDLAIRFI